MGEPQREGHRRRLALAVLLSFATYLLPLPGPHAVPLFGAFVAGSVLREGADASQAVAMIVLALAAQALTLAIAWWCLRSVARSLLLLPWFAALGAALWVLSFGVIPRATLVESDRRPDNLAWPLACEVPDATLLAPRGSGDDMASAHLAWLRVGTAGDRLGALSAEPCGAVTEVPLPAGTMHGVVAAAGGGATLESTWDVPRQATRWWWREHPAAPPRELDDFGLEASSVPVLSRDGRHLVTVVREAPPPGTPRVRIRALDGAAVADIDLATRSPGSFVPLGATVIASGDAIERAEVLLCRNEEAMLVIDLDGTISWESDAIDEASCTTFRFGGGRWLAWDGYVEGRPYRLRWQSSDGERVHELPKGHGISSAAIDPAGAWIAISTSPIYSLGGVGDAVFVLDARDGREVFRDALPAYTRSEVAFLGGGLLAYTHFDGERATVRVVRRP